MPVLMQSSEWTFLSVQRASAPVPSRACSVLSERTVLVQVDGASDGTRTHDLLITNQGLYQLSYTGFSRRWRPIRPVNDPCQRKRLTVFPKNSGAT